MDVNCCYWAHCCKWYCIFLYYLLSTKSRMHLIHLREISYESVNDRLCCYVTCSSCDVTCLPKFTSNTSTGLPAIICEFLMLLTWLLSMKRIAAWVRLHELARPGFVLQNCHAVLLYLFLFLLFSPPAHAQRGSVRSLGYTKSKRGNASSSRESIVGGGSEV